MLELQDTLGVRVYSSEPEAVSFMQLFAQQMRGPVLSDLSDIQRTDDSVAFFRSRWASARCQVWMCFVFFQAMFLRGLEN